MKMPQVLLLVALTLLFDANLGIPGGQVPYITTLTDPLVVFAVKEINKFFQNSSRINVKPREALRIVNATSQVVSGTMYRFGIEVSVGKTNQTENLAKELCLVCVLSQPSKPEPEKTTITGTITCIPEN